MTHRTMSERSYHGATSCSLGVQQRHTIKYIVRRDVLQKCGKEEGMNVLFMAV